MSGSCYFVKVRYADERRFFFLGMGGTATRLRVHAVMVADRDRAIRAADEQLEHGAEHGVVAARVTQDGRVIHHVGQGAPDQHPDPFAGYRYLSNVTRAGCPVFHITDDFDAWTTYDEATDEACAAEAARAGVEPGKRWNVHATLCTFASRQVRFHQEANHPGRVIA